MKVLDYRLVAVLKEDEVISLIDELTGGDDLSAYDLDIETEVMNNLKNECDLASFWFIVVKVDSGYRELVKWFTDKYKKLDEKDLTE